jgi:hypothetical protein
MNAEGTRKRRVTHWPGADGPVAWLPNGRIVFSHFRRDEPLPRFYWIKLNGTGIRSLPLAERGRRSDRVAPARGAGPALQLRARRRLRFALVQ